MSRSTKKGPYVILIQNIFCIQHTTIDLKIKDMVKWKTEQNGCRIDVNSNIVEF